MTKLKKDADYVGFMYMILDTNLCGIEETKKKDNTVNLDFLSVS